MLCDALPSLRTELAPESAVMNQLLRNTDQSGQVAGFDDQTSIPHNLVHRTTSVADYRPATGHRFADTVAERLIFTRTDQNVTGVVERLYGLEESQPTQSRSECT